MIKLVKKCTRCGKEYWDDDHVCKDLKEVLASTHMQPKKDTWDYVIDDIHARNEMGRKKYGVTLTPDTSEDMLQHLYEELLDATVYIKTLIIQRQKLNEVYQD